MARAKRTSPALEKGQLRATSLAAIDPNLDLDNGLTLAAYRQRLGLLEQQLNAYNGDLAALQVQRSALDAVELQLNDRTEQMLAAVGTKFGFDSNQYEQAGGTRKHLGIIGGTSVPAAPPPATAEIDPVFIVSEAAKFVPGDKAKLDNLQSVVANMPAGPPGPQGDPGLQGPPGVPGPGGPESDPVFAVSEAALLVPGDKAKLDAALQPGSNVSALANDAGYVVRATAGELYSCFGIFDGGGLTNGVRLGANQVDLQLYNMGQPVVVLSAGQKQLIGYPDYATPVPTVAACWADGVLRDSAGNAFVASPVAGLTQDVTIGGVTLHFTNGLLTGVS